MSEEMKFKDGNMTKNGISYRAVKRKETIGSDNNTIYTTTLWENGDISCNCRGWGTKKADKERDCKHCRASKNCNFSDMMTPEKMLRSKVVTQQPILVAKPETNIRIVEL